MLPVTIIIFNQRQNRFLYYDNHTFHVTRMKSQYYKLTHQRYALNSYSKKIFCRDNEEELILNRTLLICSLQYQSVVYFSALTKASNVLRQLELNFHNFLSVYSLIPTKYCWLTAVTVCKLKLSYIKSYWHRVIWHNEVLASRVRGMLQQGLLLSLKARRKWSYFGEWMWCYHPNADPNGLCLCTSDLRLNSSRKILE